MRPCAVQWIGLILSLSDLSHFYCVTTRSCAIVSITMQNCNVPQKYSINPKLGRWINKQRKKKKNPDKYGALTVEQVEQLEDLGFTWNQAP